ncbi:type V CRISPR-associated protein Cpf1 [Elizabethkingia sp. JS20170427COW]|nr:type V CRISPR-associated protein Cpf1 [Elizabethkingia sp. JS20170427COW]
MFYFQDLFFKINWKQGFVKEGLNKEEANTAILLKKDDLFYLGIMDKNHNKIFRNIPKIKSEKTFSKINYKLLPGASKMLPKVFFSAKSIGYYEPNKEIINIRNHSSHTKGGKPQDGFEKIDFNVQDCRKMIDFFKSSIEKHPEWKNFGFQFSDTQSYNTIDEFYKEIEAQGYNISYSDIPESYINQLVDEGKLYLFQIYNKDFSPYSKGTPNMHTLYWKALFTEENLSNVIYKLNGQAEIFYREKSIDDENIIVHKAKEAIGNKNPNAIKKQSTFEYDLVKDKRYTVDKFQFHVPISLNFKANGSNFINQEVLSFLKNNPDVNIIGIDRGERHLIYLSLINQKGEILSQESFNTIKDEHHEIETPYHQLLSIKEKERDEARKNWGTIENIKELKEGYLSQVVHKIAKMMVDHNTIILLEDLNFGFKRGRFKVEKQVYQKLEKMLIDKLNYLVFKDKKNPFEPGGLYNALQLTNKFTSFKDLGKQSGFLFYVPAWNTSKIDPTTGFVNLFNTKYESIEKAKKFFNNFQSILFNKKENHFEFTFNYNDFT